MKEIKETDELKKFNSQNISYCFITSNNLATFNTLVNDAIALNYNLKDSAQFSANLLGFNYCQALEKVGNYLGDNLEYELIVDQDFSNLETTVQGKIDVGYVTYGGALLASSSDSTYFGQVVTNRLS